MRLAKKIKKMSLNKMDRIPTFKKFDMSKFQIELPEKIKGTHTSFLKYTGTTIPNKPVYLQTPKLPIRYDESTGNFKFITSSSPKFQLFLDNLVNKTIDTLERDSSSFFNGKQFSRAKFETSFERLASNGVLNIRPSSRITIKDQFNNNASIDDIVNNDSIALLHFKSISYTSTLIRFNVEVAQLKLYIDQELDWCIESDTESVWDDSTPVYHKHVNNLEALNEVSEESDDSVYEDSEELNEEPQEITSDLLHEIITSDTVQNEPLEDTQIESENQEPTIEEPTKPKEEQVKEPIEEQVKEPIEEHYVEIQEPTAVIYEDEVKSEADESKKVSRIPDLESETLNVSVPIQKKTRKYTKKSSKKNVDANKSLNEDNETDNVDIPKIILNDDEKDLF